MITEPVWWQAQQRMLLGGPEVQVLDAVAAMTVDGFTPAHDELSAGTVSIIDTNRAVFRAGASGNRLSIQLLFPVAVALCS